MIRFIDLFVSLFGLILGIPVLVTLWVIIWLDTGKPIFLQKRVGQHQKPFVLAKFRTMPVYVESVPTHLADISTVTAVGRFMRSSKLDELPQLWNVLIGQMSLVGPRPCLLSQTEVIAEREQLKVFDARPGITGLAQVRGIDMSKPRLLAKTDAEMLDSLTLSNYFHYLILTCLGKGTGDPLSEKF